MSSKFRTPTPADLIKSAKSFTSFIGLFGTKSKPNINSVLLKLHSTVTSVFLVSALTLLTMNNYFGDHIECNTSKSDIPPAQIVRYCWMEGVFSSYSETQKEGYPGVKEVTEGDKIVYHRYYQWVYFVLIFQSMLFYMPKYVWRRQEGSRLTDMIEDLRDNHIDSLTPFHKSRILQDVADAMYTGNFFIFYYVLADIMCLLNVLAQTWFTNLFLGGGFSTLGYDWYIYKLNDTSKFNDPLLRIFPRQVKCTYHKYGFTGTLEKIDSLCLLPQNIVNEQIFLFLWVWYVFLIFATIFILFIRILYIFPFFRYMVLQSNSPCYNKIKLRLICKNLGNWFVLYKIARNIKPSFFVVLLDDLMEEHFDKNGTRKPSEMFRSELANQVKIDLKVRVPKKKIGFVVDGKSYNNDSSYNKNSSFDNYGNNSSTYNQDTDWDSGYNNNNDNQNSGGWDQSNSWEQNNADENTAMAATESWGCTPDDTQNNSWD
ncbi:innexin inx2-like protein [Leptotrombidium deliense]|uniref:Innexin n=1 Tax=Leptotrombidium deliense TaxID=299467 RepID=A0A443SF19_9ACAR|nr:innexin inx2-like protein [Leptotrombidium deliense]